MAIRRPLVEVGGTIQELPQGDTSAPETFLAKSFHCSSDTPGTGVATGLNTAFATNNAAIYIFNGASSGGKDIILNYFDLIVVSGGTTSTSLQALVAVSEQARYSGGGVFPAFIRNTDAGDATASVAAGTTVIGNITLFEPIVPRRVFRATLKAKAAPTPVAGDNYRINFGGIKTAAATPVNTVAGVYNFHAPIVVVPPQGCVCLNLWTPAGTVATTFEFNMSWYEQ